MRTLIIGLVFCTGCFDYSKLDKKVVTPDAGGDLAESSREDGGFTPDAAEDADSAQDTDGGTPSPDAATAPDLAVTCSPFISDPVQETPCAGGSPDQTMTSPSTCYVKTCGCENTTTCTQCYWSPWMAVTCPTS